MASVPNQEWILRQVFPELPEGLMTNGLRSIFVRMTGKVSAYLIHGLRAHGVAVN